MQLLEVSVSLIIAASPAEVFEYLVDPSTHPLWNSGLLEIRPQVRLREGAHYATVSHLMGRTFNAENRVVKLAEARELRITNQTGPLKYAITYELKPHETGTRLDCLCSIGGQVAVFNLAAPLLEYLAQSRLDADLNALKLLVENAALPGPTASTI